jgi:hypothetical protein
MLKISILPLSTFPTPANTTQLSNSFETKTLNTMTSDSARDISTQLNFFDGEARRAVQHKFVTDFADLWLPKIVRPVLRKIQGS